MDTTCLPPPDTTIWEYPGADNSWADQWKAFSRAVAQGAAATDGIAPSIASTQRVLEVVERVYQQNQVPWLEAGKAK